MIKVGFFLFCGLALVASASSPNRKFRITGGTHVKPSDVPFQIVYLVNSIITCSGVIISPTVAMTAAHCIKKNSKRSSVYAGATQLISNPGGVRKQIVRTLIHEDYDDTPGDNHNDIALLFLNTSSPFEFNELIQPAVLPSEHEDYQNSTALVRVAGWGAVDSKGTFTRHLKYTDVNLIPRDRCIKMGGNIGTNVICAGSEDGSQDFCGGDSGGPLYIGNKVIGLVSFGWPCGLTNRPGAYADLARLRTWIRRHASV